MGTTITASQAVGLRHILQSTCGRTWRYASVRRASDSRSDWSGTIISERPLATHRHVMFISLCFLQPLIDLIHRLPLHHLRKTTANESHSFPPSWPSSFLSFSFILLFIIFLGKDDQLSRCHAELVGSQHSPSCLFCHFTNIFLTNFIHVRHNDGAVYPLSPDTAFSYHRTRLHSRDSGCTVFKQPPHSSRMASC